MKKIEKMRPNRSAFITNLIERKGFNRTERFESFQWETNVVNLENSDHQMTMPESDQFVNISKMHNQGYLRKADNFDRLTLGWGRSFGGRGIVPYL